MPEALLAGVGVATEWLLTYLLHSSVLIGLAWLVVRTGRARRILSLRAGPKPASRGRRVLAGVGLLLPLLLLPAVPSPVVRHTAIFIQQWGIRTGEDVGHVLPSPGSLPRARQGLRIWLGDSVDELVEGSATFEETVVFVSGLDKERFTAES